MESWCECTLLSGILILCYYLISKHVLFVHVLSLTVTSSSVLLGSIFMFHVYTSISLSFYLLCYMCWIVSVEQLQASTFIHKPLWKQILLSSKWKLFRIEHLCHETFNKLKKSNSNTLPYHQCRSLFIFSCFVGAGNKTRGFRIFRNVLYYLSYPQLPVIIWFMRHVVTMVPGWPLICCNSPESVSQVSSLWYSPPLRV